MQLSLHFCKKLQGIRHMEDTYKFLKPLLSQIDLYDLVLLHHILYPMVLHTYELKRRAGKQHMFQTLLIANH